MLNSVKENVSSALLGIIRLNTFKTNRKMRSGLRLDLCIYVICKHITRIESFIYFLTNYCLSFMSNAGYGRVHSGRHSVRAYTSHTCQSTMLHTYTGKRCALCSLFIARNKFYFAPSSSETPAPSRSTDILSMQPLYYTA